jgi:hypothetical protein
MDRIFVTAGDWAVGANEVQWILYRRRSQARGGWNAFYFVRSSKDILAQGLREKGADDDTARFLLSGLPDTFDQWKASQSSPQPVSDPIGG